MTEEEKLDLIRHLVDSINWQSYETYPYNGYAHGYITAVHAVCNKLEIDPREYHDRARP